MKSIKSAVFIFTPCIICIQQIARSSAKANFTKGQKYIDDLRIKYETIAKLFYDNKSIIRIANNLIQFPTSQDKTY